VINFRYHVVSLTAVFLALAIGLIVGTTALNGPVADELQHKVTQLSSSNTQYRDRLNLLNQEVAQKEQFAQDVAPALLQDKLAGRRVAVVSMQGSDDYVTDALAMLADAGAKVTAQVEFEDPFTAPSNNSSLLDLAERSLTTTAITGLPANSDGVETSSALLAAVLIDHTPAVSEASRTEVLKAFEDSKYISVKGDVTGPAEAVLFIARTPYDDDNASTENQNVVTLVAQLDKAAPIVVGAAGASGSGNVIGAVTGDATLDKSVSTVDNIDTPQGRIAAVLALNEQIVYTRAGHYGLASSATSMLPQLPE
jgi:hypothetical protein